MRPLAREVPSAWTAFAHSSMRNNISGTCRCMELFRRYARAVASTLGHQAHLGACEFTWHWASWYSWWRPSWVCRTVPSEFLKGFEGIGRQAWHTLECWMRPKSRRRSTCPTSARSQPGAVCHRLGSGRVRRESDSTFIKFSTVACDFDRIQAVRRRLRHPAGSRAWQGVIASSVCTRSR